MFFDIVDFESGSWDRSSHLWHFLAGQICLRCPLISSKIIFIFKSSIELVQLLKLEHILKQPLVDIIYLSFIVKLFKEVDHIEKLVIEDKFLGQLWEVELINKFEFLASMFIFIRWKDLIVLLDHLFCPLTAFLRKPFLFLLRLRVFPSKLMIFLFLDHFLEIFCHHLSHLLSHHIGTFLGAFNSWKHRSLCCIYGGDSVCGDKIVLGNFIRKWGN